MAHLSITRLRLKAWYLLPAFFLRAVPSTNQLRDSEGFRGGYLARGKGSVFWTVTLWTSAEAMKGYRGAGAHRKALPKLAAWCDEASTASITTERDSLPDAVEAAQLMVEHGRIFKVRRPSAVQQRGETWPDRLVPASSPRVVPR